MLLLPSDDGGKPVRAVSYFNAVSLRVLSLYFIFGLERGFALDRCARNKLMECSLRRWRSILVSCSLP